MLQYYCATYFERLLEITLPQAEDVVRKRKRVQAMLNYVGLQCLEGGSTFYFFVKIDPFAGTSEQFALRLLQEKGIAVVPGCAYGESTDRFIRMSIGTETEERIQEALWIIRQSIDAWGA